jgi:hypothetical protein
MRLQIKSIFVTPPVLLQCTPYAVEKRSAVVAGGSGVFVYTPWNHLAILSKRAHLEHAPNKSAATRNTKTEQSPLIHSSPLPTSKSAKRQCCVFLRVGEGRSNLCPGHHFNFPETPCGESTPSRRRPLPSKSFPIHYSYHSTLSASISMYKQTHASPMSSGI